MNVAAAGWRRRRGGGGVAAARESLFFHFFHLRPQNNFITSEREAMSSVLSKIHFIRSYRP